MRNADTPVRLQAAQPRTRVSGLRTLCRRMRANEFSLSDSLITHVERRSLFS
jgi:hypothetical protein